MTVPTFVPPMLATLVAGPFDDPDWLYEIKWDGFRVEAVVDDDNVRLWTVDLGAVFVGGYEDGALRCAGKIRAGFTKPSA